MGFGYTAGPRKVENGPHAAETVLPGRESREAFYRATMNNIDC